MDCSDIFEFNNNIVSVSFIKCFLTAPHVESDSDHEPTSTVTIPTPPRNIDQDEDQQSRSAEYVPSKERKKEELSALSVTKEVDGSQSPVRPPPEFVWKGSISMVDVAHISITAHVVSGKYC